jgi:S-adenosylmethionine:tRNA ribosyltransferase-isomerase
MLRTDDLDYELPESLIATHPAEPRDAARLMVVSRSDASRIEHRRVSELAEILRPETLRGEMAHDLMVVNSTRVLAARFKGMRPDTGGHVEGLYVEPAPATHAEAANGPLWVVLLKMRRMKPGVRVALHDRAGRDSGISLRLIERATNDGAWIVLVESSAHALVPGMTADDLLEWVGLTPVPPYILAARRRHLEDVRDEADRIAYQTVYASAQAERPGHGSVAAPTAGLHFTPALLEHLRDAGVARAGVTLDVGLGTFKPIEAPTVEEHPMHSEWCSIPADTAQRITSTRNAGGRIIAIGTTCARTLESFASTEEMLAIRERATNLLITPGYRFKHVDALFTNFHLPRGTLMAMVGAFLQVPDGAPDADGKHAGVERLKHLYRTAIDMGYRFYSFGDAMLILP